MTISKKFNSALLTVGFIAALAVAASPASAQTFPLAGTLAGKISAYKDGSSNGRVAVEVSGLPSGTLISGKLLLGKRVLCKAATRKRVAEVGPTQIGCNFPLRKLAAKKSGARSSQAPISKQAIAQFRFEMLANNKAVEPVPFVILIPIAIIAFETPETLV